MPDTKISADSAATNLTGLELAGIQSGANVRVPASLFAADLLAPIASEVSVTTTATLDSTAFGKMHVCTGTTADYTVTLPTAVGNTGKIIGVRIASTCTKLITLDGNSTELIAGVSTRKFWALESVILMSDGAGWVRVGGFDRPMSARMVHSVVAVASNTITALEFGSIDHDDSPSARIASTATDSITPARDCYGTLQDTVSVAQSGSVTYSGKSYITKDGTEMTESRSEQSNATPAGFSLNPSFTGKLVGGSVYKIEVYSNPARNFGTTGSFQFTEISQWRV